MNGGPDYYVWLLEPDMGPFDTRYIPVLAPTCLNAYRLVRGNLGIGSRICAVTRSLPGTSDDFLREIGQR